MTLSKVVGDLQRLGIERGHELNHLAQLNHGLRLLNIGTWIEGEAQLDI